MVRVLITGANGLLGQKLITRLQEIPDFFFIATARRPLTVPLSRGVFYSMDVSNAEAVSRVFSEVKPDIVIHTAAMTNVDQCEQDRDECYRQNVTAVEHLIKACETFRTHLIHISTDFIFDGSRGPLTETDTPNPINFYGETKLEAERLIQNSRLNWCILRTVLVYGVTPDMSRSNIVLWVKKSLEEQKPIKLVNDQWRTPTLAEDLAEACYLAARKKASGIYNISGAEMMTPYDMALITAEVFDLDTSLLSVTDSNQFKQPARRPLRTGFVIDKAIRDLGYQPHSFREGVALVREQLNTPR
jgi:dTDP-4-dehydrorhamnose reductase